ncbi:MAG: diversity-generating retroelement protein Avd [Halieaceae bacterium]|nr:diversity-generating retroelement protein Avd [Halieaceae bacterium]
MHQSPIFSKTYDFILWLLNHTEHFPKSERFRMARRLEDTAFEFYELLIQAARSNKRILQTLREADLILDKLRLYLRLSHARKLTTGRQYQHAASLIAEIGNLLGGWLKSLPSTQARPSSR